MCFVCSDIDFGGFALSDYLPVESRVFKAPGDIASSVIMPLNAGIPRADHLLGLILNEDLHMYINRNNESHANEAVRQRITV